MSQQESYATFVDVVLPLYLSQEYTYRVPREWEHDIAIGKRVAIQFGARKVYSGIIVEIHHQPPQGYEAKYIYSVLDETPVLEPHNLEFWKWIRSYYLCTLGEVMNAALPAALKLESESKIVANPSFDPNGAVLDDKEFLVWEALEVKQELTLNEIGEIVQLRNVFPLLKSMVQKEMVLVRETLEERYREKTITCIKLNTQYEDEQQLEQLFQKLERYEKQQQLLIALLHLKQIGEEAEKQKLLNTAGVSASTLQTLIKKGILETYTVAVDRLQMSALPSATFGLNDAQEEAMANIKKGFEQHVVVLLQGVTGSGKTHIYVKLIEEQIAAGKQSLFLLPEIALTSQVVKRIRKFFGDTCIAYHSKFSDAERVEIWNKVKDGRVKVVIGARSAVFLPFQHLGLCIVDEEHETSFKQQEPAPRYHARDAAIMLSRLQGGKCLLGSATPSLEVYYLATQGKYGYVKLDRPYHEVDLPLIETANIAEEKRTRALKSDNIGKQLFEAMEAALANQEQIILFQNRRGFAPYLCCNRCDWVPHCRNCDISLTYHKHIDSLKCHYCGFTQSVPKSCAACGSVQLSLKGAGTERIEEELQALFPEARVARLDLDAAKTKYGHEEIIRNFEDRKFDILVGTQMLSKGLDFEHVGLVGVVQADALLHFPDFRAHERAMQLLLQVSGRSGRKHKQGRVIIQTSVPNHMVLQALVNRRLEPFMQRELEERERFGYPPYHRLIKLVLRHKDHEIVSQASVQLKQLLLQHLSCTVLGPESPYVSKIRNLFIKEILIKVHRSKPGLDQMKSQIRQAVKALTQDRIFRSVYVYADVDPG